MPFIDCLTRLEALQELLEDMPEASTDTEAVVRLELMDVIARAAVLLRALSADEK